MGRSALLTRERADKIIAAIEAGNWLVTAAGLAGVTAKTVRNWLKRAEEPDAEPEFIEFADRFRAVQAEAENQLVVAVKNGAAVDPKCAQWLLEKRFPGRWGKRAEPEAPRSPTHTTIIVLPAERPLLEDGKAQHSTVEAEVVQDEYSALPQLR